MSRFGINVAFACVVALLALAAATFIYESSSEVTNQPAGAPSASQMPENQASPDAKRLAELEQLAAGNPQNPEYRAQIGNIYYDMAQYDKAVNYYQQSLDLHPRDPNVETDLATCYHYLGQDDKSLELLNKVLGYSPGFSQALYNKGIVLINGKKNVKEGIAVWEDLLRSDPNYPNRAELEQKINQMKGSAAQ